MAACYRIAAAPMKEYSGSKQHQRAYWKFYFTREETIKMKDEAENINIQDGNSILVNSFRKAYPSIRGFNQAIFDDVRDNIMSNHTLLQTVDTLRSNDHSTWSHSVNTAWLALAIGAAINADRKTLYDLGTGALLHDIGKLLIKRNIIDKAERLTQNEYFEVMQHAFRGYQYLCKNCVIPEQSRLIALQHHEKYDGSGYPYGIKKNNISLISRITSVADVYEALTSDRVYRKAVSPSEAIDFIRNNSGKVFDPEIVDIFCNRVST